MSSLHTLVTATHVAVIDPTQGHGSLVCPPASLDHEGPVRGESLHEADWSEILREALKLGFEPSLGDDGEIMREPAGGLEVVALEGNATDTDWSAEAFMDARGRVLDAALEAFREIVTV